MSTIDKDEDIQTGSGGSKPGNSSACPPKGRSKLRKKPCCVRCSNHGLIISLKEHKRYCRHRFCECPSCQLTVQRQKVQAKQTALKRALEMDRNKIILPVEVNVPSCSFTRGQRVSPSSSCRTMRMSLRLRKVKGSRIEAET